ncbi:MAG: hypothetical protein CMN28_07690 [Salinisphaeraceae bacterium]|jgi:hypothetical protein|nr:hypothetical protein [Salinisphaeraceae bacterium]
MNRLIDRMRGAAALDAKTYEAVEHDESATLQAGAVVVMSAVCMGLGRGAGEGALIGAVVALLGWLIWASTVWLVGTKLLPAPRTEADIGQLLRTLGFASAPGIVGIAGVVPLLGGLALLAANIWMLCANVVAARQALDYESTGRAIGVVVLGWIPYAILLGLVV